MKKHILPLLLSSALLAASCDSLDVKGMFFSSGTHTEERVAEWLEWNEQHEPVVISGAPDTYNVYICSDIHITDSAPRLEQMLTDEQGDPAGLFSVVNGDLANEAGEDPFRVVDSLSGLYADPTFTTIGNHDIYFDCQNYYKQYFHTSSYTVEVRTIGGNSDLFIFLDSGNATHGRRQLQWLRDVLSHRSQYRHVTVFTHTCLFRTSYNYSTTPAANLPEEEYYELVKLMSDSEVSLFVMGHFHHCEEHRIGNVPYVMTNYLADPVAPSYLVATYAPTVSYAFKKI